MKKLLLSVFFAFLLVRIGFTQGCVCANQYPANTLTPTQFWSDVDACNYAGEYAVINVTAGNIYEFSTCSTYGSSILYDTELTLLSDQQSLLAYNDDFCGTQSYISWTATYTGTVQIHLTEYFSGSGCWTNTTCSNIRFKMTPGAVSIPANNFCANATTLTPSANCNLTSGTTIGATEDPYPDPSCDMPGVYNDVWYSFNSGAYTSLDLTVNLGTAALIGVEFYSTCGTLATGLSLGGTPGNCDFNTNAPNPTVITGLTPNTTYRMRMFTNASYDTPGTFTTCLTTPPPPTVSVNSTNICAGQSVTLTATPSAAGGTFLWSNGATTPTITVTPNATTTYSVTYSNNGTASASGIVTVDPLPNINGGQDQTICQGSQATLSATGGILYSWDNGVTNGAAFTPSNTTTYTVTGTDANGCTNTDQVLITVNPTPSASVPANQSVCAGATTSAVNFTGTAGATFSWVNSNPSIGLGGSGNGNISAFVANNPNATPAIATISITPTLGSCTGSVQNFTITVNPAPSAPTASNQSICAGQTATISASNLANWYTVPTGGVSLGQASSYTTGSLSAGTYTYYMEGVSGGCTSATRNAVTVTVNPSPSISGNTVLCPNSSSQLTGTGTAAANTPWVSNDASVAIVSNSGIVMAMSFGTAIITYTANTGCSVTTSINVTNPTTPTFAPIAPVCAGGNLQLPASSTNNIQGTWSPAVNNAQTTTYTFTPNAGQCATTTQVTVNVNPSPNINGGNTLCAGGTLQLTGTGTAAANNAWTSSNATNASISNSGLVNGLLGGTTQISYTDDLGCTATELLTINAQPQANAGQDQTLCAGGIISLVGSANGGTAPYIYSWDNGVQNGIPFNLNNTGSYTLTVTDANGCSGTDQVNLTATAIDWANLQWPVSGIMCLGQTHNIYGQIYVAGITNGPGQAPSVNAQVGISTTNTDPSTWPANAWSNATFNTQVGNNDEFTAGIGNLLAAGTYYYTFRYSLGQGCPYYYGGFNGGHWDGSNNTNGSLTINPAPNANITASACESYTWYGQTYTQSGTYTHTVPSGAGCDSVLYLNLTINNNVNGQTITESVCNSYLWNGQTYTQSGTYTFTGTTQNGCDSTVTLILTIFQVPSNIQVSSSQGTFSASAQNAVSFAWLDCSTNTLIPGENSATFTPTLSGSYAAIVSNACGSDTSTCEPIEVQGINENSNAIISIYPNPSEGIFTISAKDALIENGALYTLNGELLQQQEYDSQEISIDLSGYATGSYLLYLQTNKQTKIFKLLKL